MKKSRVNGFQSPRSKEQIFTWITYPFSTLLFILLVILSTDGITRVAVLLIQIILITIILFTWFIVEYLDPADDIQNKGKEGTNNFSGIPVVCISEGKRTAYQYCSQCNKRIRVLDHHCIWLNTCVGARTYVPFLVLVITCLCQMSLQITFGVMMVFSLSDTQVQNKIIQFGLTTVSYLVGSIIQISVSSIIGVSAAVLATFHIYLLLVVHGTTYDFKLKAMGGFRCDSDFEAREESRKRKLSELSKAEALARDAKQQEKQKRRARYGGSVGSFASSFGSYRSKYSQPSRYSQHYSPSPSGSLSVSNTMQYNITSVLNGLTTSPHQSTRIRPEGGDVNGTNVFADEEKQTTAQECSVVSSDNAPHPSLKPASPHTFSSSHSFLADAEAYITRALQPPKNPTMHSPTQSANHSARLSASHQSGGGGGSTNTSMYQRPPRSFRRKPSIGDASMIVRPAMADEINSLPIRDHEKHENISNDGVAFVTTNIVFTGSPSRLQTQTQIQREQLTVNEQSKIQGKTLLQDAQTTKQKSQKMSFHEPIHDSPLVKQTSQIKTAGLESILQDSLTIKQKSQKLSGQESFKESPLSRPTTQKMSTSEPFQDALDCLLMRQKNRRV